MTEAENEKLEELLHEAAELRNDAESIIEALECAETCETMKDTKANLREARDEALKLARRIDALLGGAQ